MIGWICFALLFVGVAFSAVTGTVSEVNESILAVPEECITLVIHLCGPLCLFCGLIRVAERSGLVAAFSRLLVRPVGMLIPETKGNGQLREAVSMNLASNFFGLGNAATPYGIRACRCFDGRFLTVGFASFLMLNTCSLQLIPTTVAALRTANGAQTALDILPAVWCVQVLGCVFGLILVRLVFRRRR